MGRAVTQDQGSRSSRNRRCKVEKESTPSQSTGGQTCVTKEARNARKRLAGVPESSHAPAPARTKSRRVSAVTGDGAHDAGPDRERVVVQRSSVVNKDQMGEEKGSDGPKVNRNKGSDGPKVSRNKGSDEPKISRGKGSVEPKISRSKGSDGPKISGDKGSDGPKVSRNKGSDGPKISRGKGSDGPKVSKRTGGGQAKTGTKKSADKPKASKFNVDGPKIGTDKTGYKPKKNKGTKSDTPENSKGKAGDELKKGKDKAGVDEPKNGKDQSCSKPKNDKKAKRNGLKENVKKSAGSHSSEGQSEITSRSRRVKVAKPGSKTEGLESAEMEAKVTVKAKASKRAGDRVKGKSESAGVSPEKKQKRGKQSEKTCDVTPKNEAVPMPALDNAPVDMSDIKGLLMRFEGGDAGTRPGGIGGGGGVPVAAGVTDGRGDDMDDSSEGEWEEVAEEGEEENTDKEKQQLPTEAVQITLEATSIMRKKRKKKKFDMEEWFRLQRNRKRKESQAHAHKVHLLCLLARGFHLSATCGHPLLQGALLSLVPEVYHSLAPSQWGLVKLTQLTTWFTRLFPLFPDATLAPCKLVTRLVYRVGARLVGGGEELVLLYVAVLRVLGLDARIVISFRPLPHRADDLEAKTKDDDDETEGATTKTETASKPGPSPTAQTKVTSESDVKSSSGKGKSKGKSSRAKMKSQTSVSKSTKIVSKQTLRKEAKSGGTMKQAAKTLRRRQSASRVDYCEESAESDGEKGEAKKKNRKKKKERANSKEETDDAVAVSDSESDFEEVQTSFRSPSHSRTTAKVPASKNAKPIKIVSSDSEANSVSAENDTNVWAEVFLPSENSWICVDCVRNLVKCRESMEEVATKPLHYVIAFQQGGYVAKDVTRKYASQWLLETRKGRLDDDWWQGVMAAYRDSAHAQRERDEELFMETLLQKAPLPTSISLFKGHSLYALQRHLLKFEAIYPPDAAPVGFIKGEPVYARRCVHTLHSRETWLKEARMVRLKEEPYKWVKARPKKNQVNYNPEEKSLPIFGFWQTEDYIPPPAVDGKVPRNAYGNVELFKPCMLPGGTVHLNIPGLNKVARKLGIDCVPAMVGWEAHCGFSHPILEGFIVCEEHKDTLLAACDEEQEIQREREEEKREKRVLDNWTRLTKGLLIRKRLKEKYDLTDPHGQEKEKEKKKSKKSPHKPTGSELAADVSTAWPLNRQAERKQTTGKRKPEVGPLFPFEVETM